MVALGIADDEPDILRLFKMMLGSKGYPIAYTAMNGAEAVEMHRARPADIVIIDYNMPYMDGLEAARTILEEFPNTKVFLMTCGEDIMDLVKGLRGVTILKKPFPFKAVIEMLDRLSSR
ncbi:Response regulator [Methanocella conradii HZ254]|uniref:Response regulator n=1 Tax=Methanocella conradii (strain DSM 24694 / JCM 17849 / CGMCC 1.5162 / HZ254) TaxID=1041930 RepID=H8I861_METCZ|nr:response regulator [Methanocella conradii]AFD00879.1 Response regulator [Methanocella conradii HZ254]MDI6897560.1 response regulator [Methanocella conradii]